MKISSIKFTDNIKRRIIAGFLALTCIGSVATLSLVKTNAATTNSISLNESQFNSNTYFTGSIRAILNNWGKGMASTVPGLSFLAGPISTMLKDICGVHEVNLTEINKKLDDIQRQIDSSTQKIIKDIYDQSSLVEYNRLVNEVLTSKKYALELIDVIKDETNEVKKNITLAGLVNNDFTSTSNYAHRISDLENYINSPFGYNKSVFTAYYNKMKNESMFGGEAAYRAENYVNCSMEIFSASAFTALLSLDAKIKLASMTNEEFSALDEDTQQTIKNMNLNKSAITAAMNQLKGDMESVLKSYNNYQELTEEETTTYVGKSDDASKAIKLKKDLGVVKHNCKNNNDISADLFDYWCRIGHHCDYSYIKSMSELGENSRGDIKRVEINEYVKALSYDKVKLIIEHIQKNFSDRSISQYLRGVVGFRFTDWYVGNTFLIAGKVVCHPWDHYYGYEGAKVYKYDYSIEDVNMQDYKCGEIWHTAPKELSGGEGLYFELA